MRKWVTQCLAPILCALAVLGGVAGLGRAARSSLHGRAAYTLPFADIDCEPPDGLSRRAFLADVRRVAHQRNRLHLLDAELPDRLRRAFAAHPWVASVRLVQCRPTSADRRPGLRVELSYREPVLAVRLAGEEAPRGKESLIETCSCVSPDPVTAGAVDRDGVVLPSAARPDLPTLTVEHGPAGEARGRWDDPRVLAAAATLDYLKPHLARLRLEGCEVEVVGGEVVLRRPGVRVVWGHAPGHESEGEAPADVKLNRLLQYQQRHDGLDRLEHDVRLLAFQGHFPLLSGADR